MTSGAWLVKRAVLGVALASSLAVGLGVELGRAQAPQTPGGPREVPARPLPVPTDVSPETAKIIAGAPSANWNVIPKTPEEWATAAGRGAGAPGGIGPGNQALLDRFNVTSEPMMVNGVNTYMLTPKDIPLENRNRLLVHVHGGCYVMGGGGRAEGIYMAGFGRMRCCRSTTGDRPPRSIRRRSTMW